MTSPAPISLHDFLDHGYGPDGDAVLRSRLDAGADPNTRDESSETPLHVATRRRRVTACVILLDAGAEINARTAGGQTAYTHAIRRTFDDVVALLAARGADATLASADEFAVAVTTGEFDAARALLTEDPTLARVGNPEQDRLLADVAGRGSTTPVRLLIEAGADLAAPGLDGGTALHQAAWFGQPGNTRLLIDAGAPLEAFDPVHASSPIGWVAHGSRYSGDAAAREADYVAIARMLLEAGASLADPREPDGDGYRRRLLEDASPAVAEVLRADASPGI